MLKLIPIEQDYNTEQHTEEPLRPVLDGTIAFYQAIGKITADGRDARAEQE